MAAKALVETLADKLSEIKAKTLVYTLGQLVMLTRWFKV